MFTEKVDIVKESKSASLAMLLQSMKSRKAKFVFATPDFTFERAQVSVSVECEASAAVFSFGLLSLLFFRRELALVII